MNKNYIYNDGTVTVIDENGNARPIEYSDNLEEILIQENLIEEMENEFKELEKVDKKTKRYIPNFVPAVFLAMVVLKTIIPSLGADAMIDTVFGTMNLSTVTIGVSSILTLPLATAMDIAVYNQEKQKNKKIRSNAAKYDYLKNEIEIQKGKLEELKQEKTKTNENNEFKVEKVDDIEALNTLKKHLILYSNLAYSIEKYYKLYENGKLEEYLKNEGYSDDTYECAKEYIEEKGLVNRNKH